MHKDSLNPKAVANLEKLSAFLKRAVPPPTFDMRRFAWVDGMVAPEFERYWNVRPDDITTEMYQTCGTVACAVGHGPLAGIPAKAGETWSDYAYRAFGLEQDSAHTPGYIFNWLFGEDWGNSWDDKPCVDNTPGGAAARIDYYLEHGVPEFSFPMMRGDQPICYTIPEKAVQE